MRLLAALVAAVALLSAGCASRSADPNAPRYGGFGTVTAAGLQVVDGACLYSPNQVVASGTIRETGPGAGTQISVTAYVPVLGSAHFERTAVYPAPAVTGADVPFRIAVETGDQPGLDCDMQVSWTG
jgi:hypothetical protein